jgi:hypothetical protein
MPSAKEVFDPTSVGQMNQILQTELRVKELVEGIQCVVPIDNLSGIETAAVGVIAGDSHAFDAKDSPLKQRKQRLSLKQQHGDRHVPKTEIALPSVVWFAE